MRIIGGALKGKNIFSVPGRSIRPTADRLRESIFNILSMRTQDTTVLDLFAGTGALGIEALSRGSKFAVFIDIYQKAIAVIKRNLKSCALENKTRIIKWDIARNLNCITGNRPTFNLVLMDPPYGKNIIEPALTNLHLSDCLEKGALIVIEHTPYEPICEDIDAYIVSDQRKYGKTLVSILSYML